jgi:hypothetical protein
LFVSLFLPVFIPLDCYAIYLPVYTPRGQNIGFQLP